MMGIIFQLSSDCNNAILKRRRGPRSIKDEAPPPFGKGRRLVAFEAHDNP